ncbi:HET-domain-containing protein [Durotheca rogersii]|uniref:HET-domain-containing protein n=1 Tax=Durotheca rogersii TaxID=419775 RepID=UPI002220B4AC|nr:HET-domain-containing protein [Durotheca rogersii]KAI5860303.1 HET-domain-containing protein [Durotheca rogersii]
MLCLGHCLPMGSRTRQVKDGLRSKNTQTEPGCRERNGRFSYSSVPLNPKQGNPQSRTIRVLRLLPTKVHGLPSCQIRTIEFDSAQRSSYHALSYTWGPTTREEARKGMNDERNCPITCNGRPLLVTKNLFNCLSQLEKNRYYGQDLWADAICVNQDDREELCGQVSIMADIYRSADRVIIWLGAADEFTPYAWKLVDKLSGLSKEDMDSITPSITHEQRHPDLLGDLNSREYWTALALLFGRAWFTRAWVVQEFVLSRRTRMLCGDYPFRWDNIVAASHLMSKKVHINTFQGSLPDNFGVDLLSYKNPAKLAAIKRDVLAAKGDVLLHSLIRCRTYEASKNHDKVYSLVGLTIPQGNNYPSSLYPNYDSSLTMLYIGVAIYILKTTDHLHLLAHAEGDAFRNDPELPSWVPDWSVRKDLGLRITGYERYRAAGERPCFKIVRGSRALIVRGFELDTVSRVGATKAEVSSARDCADWLDLVRELERDDPTRDHRDAFWRTLLIDTDPSGQVPIRQPWEGAFEVWMGLPRPRPPTDAQRRRAAEFETSFAHSPHLRLFRTARGHLGCGSLSCRQGDSVWIVQGSRVPLILRPAPWGAYTLVGGTYLHGFMQGEALEGREGQEFGELTLV